MSNVHVLLLQDKLNLGKYAVSVEVNGYGIILDWSTAADLQEALDEVVNHGEMEA